VLPSDNTTMSSDSRVASSKKQQVVMEGEAIPAAILPAAAPAASQKKRSMPSTVETTQTNQAAQAVTLPTSIASIKVPPLKTSYRPVKRAKLTPPSYSELMGAVNNLQQSLKANPDGGGDIRNNSVFSVGYYVDQLYAQITEIKRWGDDVVRYKDRNFKDAALVRIPKASTDKAFQPSAKKWIPIAMSLNGNGDVDSAIRRCTRYFIKNHKEAVLAALAQEKIHIFSPMNEKQIATMMKDSRVRITADRTKIMKHLRDHCGKDFLPSIMKVETLMKKMKEEEEEEKEAAKKEKGKGGGGDGDGDDDDDDDDDDERSD